MENATTQRDGMLGISEATVPADAAEFRITSEVAFDERFEAQKLVLWEMVEGGLTVLGVMAGERSIWKLSKDNPAKASVFHRTALGNGVYGHFIEPGEKLSVVVRNDLGRNTKVAASMFGRFTPAS